MRIKESKNDRLYAVRIAKTADAQDVEPLAQKKEDDRRERSAKAHYEAASRSLKGRGR